MKINVPEAPKIDDGFYKDCNVARVTACSRLASMAPAPDDVIKAVLERRLSQARLEHKDIAHLGVADNPWIDWARGRAALNMQLTYWEQRFNAPIVTVQDFYATDTGITSLFPAYIESEIQAGMLAAGIVNDLIFGSETVNSSKVEALYDSTGEAERNLRKIAEGAELPRVSLTLADSVIVLYKYGRAIDASYESLASQRIDALGHHLRRVAAQVAIDETDAALDTLVGGDGTTMGAAESDSTDQDVATAGAIAYSDLISWYYGMDNPYMIDKAVFGDTDLALINQLAEFKDSSYTGFGSNFSVPGPKAVRYLRWTGGVTGSNYVDRIGVGIDSRAALRKYTWLGGPGGGGLLQEQDKIITRQVNVYTFSYYTGFRKWDKDAVHVLDVNAAL